MSAPFTAFIVNRHGIVHRQMCAAVPVLGKQVPVTRNQCLVYKLPHCPVCWSSADVFGEAIGLRRGRV